jgi:hypothetical protein
VEIAKRLSVRAANGNVENAVKVYVNLTAVMTTIMNATVASIADLF